MKKRFLRVLISGFMAFVIWASATASIPCKAATQSNVSTNKIQSLTDYSQYVFTSKSKVEDYLKNLYPSATSISFRQNTEVKLNSKNHSQDSCFEYYKTTANRGSTQDLSADGTCWATAVSSIVEYYNKNSLYRYTDFYRSAIDDARYNHYVCFDNCAGGLWTFYNDDVLAHTFNKFGISGKTCTNYKNNIYNKLVKEINENDVTLFGTPNHAMCGCGYTSWTVTYKVAAGPAVPQIVVTHNFVIVNDTWSNYRQYSYYPATKINENPSALEKAHDWLFELTVID